MGTVETILAWSVPGGTLLMVAVGGYELLRQKRRKRPGTPLTATYVNEFTAMFYGSKRTELDHRDSVSLLREEDAEGAPPNHGVDLDRGVVVLRRDDQRGPTVEA
ncbi:hypothetical protein [Alloactinosynnema sp. L-07]|uniref:DUF6191 domain-containing protein n=1 Tax=Alloactinosynnema sp. L-07 TaxID=1653480 RepID=UPI00065EFCB0|nr:DUF6191 domain-containing protein [Alloactinosynnema sp. L-07]CRK60499.1 hypothetical protein [Alloactinosynnema sp. L-07]